MVSSRSLPVELARGAGPDQGNGSAACADRERSRRGFRIAFNDPGWLDRRQLEIHPAMGRFNKWNRHRSSKGIE
jgi:hypothetical protein